MSTRSIVLNTVALVATIVSTTAMADTGWQQPTRPASPALSSVCTSFATLSTTTTAGANLTNGNFGTPEPGETYLLSVSGPGTGSFRMVGDPGGTVTYAGPAAVPGTISYTVTNPTPPVGASGIGFYFDSGAGTVTITASCSAIPLAPTPTISVWGMAILALLLALGGIAGAQLFHFRSRQS